ncbi:hypothetical protein GHT06_008341 [Daphnia sinensis]|uniref:DH domain-containing protein n=1 Tax=Daphnia sinensis TaxID=1820382 RepID=A0AAD5Q2M3_9CRUS|nr:hypothetical protein GHT06_008341 [Daphnia sinensis]
MEDYLGLTIVTNERHHPASPKPGKESCETRSSLPSVENPDIKPEQLALKKKPYLPTYLHLENFEKIPSVRFASESLTEPKPENKLQFPQQLYQSVLTNIETRNSTKSDSYNPPQNPPLPLKQTKHRTTYLWSETWGKETALTLTKQEITRQETLYELWQGECNLIEDLSMLQRIYHDSLLRLGYITEIEANLIFGGIQMLIPIHIELREQLLKSVRTDGCFENVAGRR